MSAEKPSVLSQKYRDIRTTAASRPAALRLLDNPRPLWVAFVGAPCRACAPPPSVFSLFLGQDASDRQSADRASGVAPDVPAPPSGRAAPPAPARFDLHGCAVAALAMGAAVGFFIWMVGAPQATLHIGMASAPRGMFRGLAPALAIGFAFAGLASLLLTALEATRLWRGRLALAAGALYLAGLSSMVGGVALIAAPAAVVAGAVVLRRREIRLDGFLLALHLAGLGTAICLFHQLPQYLPGWAPFVGQFKALAFIWFGPG